MITVERIQTTCDGGARATIVLTRDEQNLIKQLVDARLSKEQIELLYCPPPASNKEPK